MKRFGVLLIVCVMLMGCSGKDAELQRAMSLRAKLLASSCAFDGEITADYGDEIYTFSVTCEGDSQGTVGFRVTAPESIAGITGIADQEGGKLTFSTTALAFPLLADDQLSPAGAPYILLKTLRGGYLTAANMEDGLLRLTIDDSYSDDAMQLDIWLNDADQPVRAEILYDGRRILTMTVSNFQIL